jgi:adenine-specific DNA-methyltransferase
MANEIAELLNQIQDSSVRSRLAVAIAELKKTKTFGLSYEQHLPELIPVFSAPIRKGVRVCLKRGALTDTFTVKRVVNGTATLIPEQQTGEERHISTRELLVVKKFGEPIFPILRPVQTVRLGGDAPHHTLIEADNYHALQLLEWLYKGKVDCIYIDPPYNTGARDWKYNNNYVDENDGWRHSKWLAFMEKRLRIAK